MNDKLKEFIQRSVHLKLEIDRVNMDIDQVYEDCKEYVDIKRGDFNKYVNTAYDKQKVKNNIESQRDILERVEEMGF